MQRSNGLHVVVIGFVALLCGAGAASSALPEPFAARLQEASSSSAVADDLRLAEDLVQAVRQTASRRSAAQVRAMCRTARELVRNVPRGYAMAVEALLLLAEHAPDRRVDTLDRANQLAQRRLKLAEGNDQSAARRQLARVRIALAEAMREDDVRPAAAAYYERAAASIEPIDSHRAQELRREAARVRVSEQIEQLKSRLEERARDRRAADQLMRLLLVERGDVQAALEYEFIAEDEKLKRYARWVAEPLGQLDATECRKLGDWYRKMHKAASVAAKPRLRQRAKECYRRYLRITDAGKDGRSAVRRAMRSLDGSPADQARASAGEAKGDGQADQPESGETGQPGTEVARANADSGAAADKPSADAPSDVQQNPADGEAEQRGDGWTPLLADLDPQRHAVAGEWDTAEGVLTLKQPSGRFSPVARLRLPGEPGDRYALRLSFRYEKADGIVGLILPVGPSSVRLMCGVNGGAGTALANVQEDGRAVPRTSESASYEPGERYRLRVAVWSQRRRAAVVAWLGDKRVFRWRGDPAKLSVPSGWGLADNRAVGVFAQETTVRFGRIERRPLPPAAVAELERGVFDRQGKGGAAFFELPSP